MLMTSKVFRLSSEGVYLPIDAAAKYMERELGITIDNAIRLLQAKRSSRGHLNSGKYFSNDIDDILTRIRKR